MPTQNQYNITQQLQRKINIQIYLLNYKYQIVGELSGVTISYPNFETDCTSDIRRTCQISLTPTDSSFDIKEGNKIWLDKYIQIYVNVLDRNNQAVKNNMGIYLVNNPTHVYDATQNVLNIEGLDLMSKMTGLRNGQLTGLNYIISSGTNARTAIIQTIALGGFTNYVIDELPYTIPNDINIDRGGTIYDILKAINEYYPTYQMYFDVDGIFHFEPIPTGYNEQIMIDDSVWEKNLLSYSKSIDFENVKNVIEVYGAMHDVTNYGGTASVSNNIYSITVADVSSLTNGALFGFTTTSSVAEPQLKINSFTTYPIKNEDGTYPILSTEETYYCVNFVEDGTNSYYKFLGHLEPIGIVSDDNPNSPFYIGGNLGTIRKIFYGGEYDNINSDYLALIRARYELYNYCKLQDSITLNCVPIYWLDVNWVISITLPNKNGEEETNLYITKKISTSGDIKGEQSVTCMRYYPLYESI